VRSLRYLQRASIHCMPSLRPTQTQHSRSVIAAKRCIALTVLVPAKRWNKQHSNSMTNTDSQLSVQLNQQLVTVRSSSSQQ
jgi:hypothetical protein